MKAIHRTNDYTENYNIVEVLKNPISNTNHFAHIKMEDGKEYITGGILCPYNEITIKVLDTLTPKQQYDWLRSVRERIYVA